MSYPKHATLCSHSLQMLAFDLGWGVVQLQADVLAFLGLGWCVLYSQAYMAPYKGSLRENLFPAGFWT